VAFLLVEGRNYLIVSFDSQLCGSGNVQKSKIGSSYMSGLFVKKGGLPKPVEKHSQQKICGSMNPRIYRQMFGEIAPEQPQPKQSNKK